MKAYRGDIVFAPGPGELTTLQNGAVLVAESGVVQQALPALPEGFEGEVVEYGGRLLLPGFVDVHAHSSQLPICGLGYDESPTSWLERYTYPVEKKYASPAYAAALNRRLVYELWENGTTRAVLMSTTSASSTQNLMEQLEQSGLSAYVGKMNSDFAGFGGEANETTAASVRETEELVKWALHRGEKVKYALCPEFIPCCSEEAMARLGALAQQYGLPVHSHMAEGPEDVAVVRRRFPKEALYARVYNHFGLLGQTPTIMAHCLYATEEEMELLQSQNVMVAHCANAILNIPSGRYLPVRKYLAKGMRIGLGSDIGGGHTLNMPRNMVAAIQVSKLYPEYAALTVPDVFYLATKGGGSFFGKVGSFEAGYQFDALVVDDTALNEGTGYTLAERLARFIYCGERQNIQHRYCGGTEIHPPRP